MVQEFACPGCGETEELTGKPSPKGIKLHCDRCDRSWLRDAEPEKCVTCGGTDIAQHQRALTQYSRGTQLSIVGLVPISLCRVCDRQIIEWAESGRAVPFNYRSAALDPDALADRPENDEKKNVVITP